MNDTPVSTTAPVPDVARLGYAASRSSGWMKLLGVVSILEGALAVLTLWGILFAWLPIWLGVLLFRASEDAEMAGRGDLSRLEPYLQRLNRYFVIQGIVTLLGVVAGVIVFFAVGMAFIAELF